MKFTHEACLQLHQCSGCTRRNIGFDIYPLNEQRAVSSAAAPPAIPLLMSWLLYTQSSGQLMRGWIIYIRCLELTLAHLMLLL